MSMGERPSVGKTMIPMPYCMVSEGEKIGIQKLIDLQRVLTNSRNFTRIAGRLNIKGPIIFVLDIWWKEPYPNKAGNARDDDDED